MEDDYLMDDDEVLDEDGYYNTPVDEEDEEDDNLADSDSDIESDGAGSKKSAKKAYGKEFTENELKFMSIYDDITAAGKSSADDVDSEIVNALIGANPRHTSSMTRINVAQEVMNKQGHNRMRNTLYAADSSLTGEDVDDDFVQTDDAGLNAELVQEYKAHIARFIDYLANRDLSKDSTNSRNRKQRQLPAFIILMFSSGLYDLILHCPTMPPEYDKQINNAMKTLSAEKDKLVEELAKKYEEVGRQEVADRVRKLGVRWFSKEPAEIKTAADYKDLKLTAEDVAIYREYRSRYMNISKSITQDVISDLIEVVVDKEAGIYAKLKDKTRSAAIEDVKQVYREWAKENSGDFEIAKKLIFKSLV